ncbi:hypothetical protein HPB50_015928 [Hyalomma asiaticum]|uniref:Uncharacterized protein n=1 Tax=Hyalomma asiaticum TaxID=266040 RepID=A0ACB7RXW1_HYAAI|nr:hypothetical protein HPB50_015928 [Hyalomma asiaticum]
MRFSTSPQPESRSGNFDALCREAARSERTPDACTAFSTGSVQRVLCIYIYTGEAGSFGRSISSLVHCERRSRRSRVSQMAAPSGFCRPARGILSFVLFACAAQRVQADVFFVRARENPLRIVSFMRVSMRCKALVFIALYQSTAVPIHLANTWDRRRPAAALDEIQAGLLSPRGREITDAIGGRCWNGLSCRGVSETKRRHNALRVLPAAFLRCTQRRAARCCQGRPTSRGLVGDLLLPRERDGTVRTPTLSRGRPSPIRCDRYGSSG